MLQSTLYEVSDVFETHHVRPQNWPHWFRTSLCQVSLINIMLSSTVWFLAHSKLYSEYITTIADLHKEMWFSCLCFDRNYWAKGQSLLTDVQILTFKWRNKPTWQIQHGTDSSAKNLERVKFTMVYNNYNRITCFFMKIIKKTPPFY